jgi:hypothetical protein
MRRDTPGFRTGGCWPARGEHPVDIRQCDGAFLGAVDDNPRPLDRRFFRRRSGAAGEGFPAPR